MSDTHYPQLDQFVRALSVDQGWSAMLPSLGHVANYLVGKAPSQYGAGATIASPDASGGRVIHAITTWARYVGVANGSLILPLTPGPDQPLFVTNESAFECTVDPNGGTIRGAASLWLGPGDFALLRHRTTNIWHIAALRQEAIKHDSATSGDFTWTPLVSPKRMTFNGVFTGNRTVTLSATAVQSGDGPQFARVGGSGFNLSVGGLKNVAASQAGRWGYIPALAAYRTVEFSSL